MNLDELRSVQRDERQRDSLRPLRDTFYEDVAAYLEGLKEERQRAVAAADDPFSSDDVRQLTDEIDTAKEIANAVYERRVGKVVKLASFSAADMQTDEEGMTAEERELFDDLVGRIRQNRQEVLATLDGQTGAGAADTDTDATTPDSADSTAADDVAPAVSPADGSGSETARTDADAGLLSDALGDSGDSAPASTGDDSPRPADEAAAVAGDASDASDASRGDTPSASPNADAPHPTNESGSPADTPASDGADESVDETAAPDRTTVRITADVGSILGVDEVEYELAREDVVTLPTTNAEPLIEREAAEPFE